MREAKDLKAHWLRGSRDGEDVHRLRQRGHRQGTESRSRAGVGLLVFELRVSFYSPVMQPTIPRSLASRVGTSVPL